MKRFYIFNHQGKELPFLTALETQYKRVSAFEDADFFVTDIDIPTRIVNFQKFLANGKPMFIIPHAGTPPLLWDYPSFPPSGYADLTFVQSEGHRKIMRAYCYPGEIRVCGWSYSKIEPEFQLGKYDNICFAPVHPAPSGFLSRQNRLLNEDIFRKLLEFCRKNDKSLTVRYIGDLPNNGISHEIDVHFVHGRPDQSIQDIQDNDLIVAVGTYANLALALGKPVAMFGQKLIPHHGKSQATLERVKNFEKYQHLMRYPFDLSDDDPDYLFEVIMESHDIMLAWRRHMIGAPFDPGVFLQEIHMALERSFSK